MQSSLADGFQNMLQQGALLFLSCLDDVLIVSLSKLGVTLPGLPWLSTGLLTVTVLFWLYRIGRFLHRRYRLRQAIAGT